MQTAPHAARPLGLARILTLMLAAILAWFGTAVIRQASASTGPATQAAQPADMTPDESLLTPPQRDRAAIRAMAGTYAVQFQARETVPLRPGYELADPFEAEATEMVVIAIDKPDRIVLQHILVLADPTGKTEEHHVIKHWRQDWRFEDRTLYEFQGDRTWARRRLTPEEAAGTWSQAVFHVDDSPRYEGYGKWTHRANVSSWTSNWTWRPVPRRDASHRDDYDVLVSRTRHTLMPQGWVHEQDNLKRVLGEDMAQPILVREAALNSYHRTEDHDFGPGRSYWNDTDAFWAAVRAAWSDRLKRHERIRLRGKVDDKRLYQRMFDLAEAFAGGPADQPPDRDAIRRVIDRYQREPKPAEP